VGVLGGLRNVARSEGAGEGFESADQDTFFWGIECGAWRDVFFWLFILFSFAFYNKLFTSIDAPFALSCSRSVHSAPTYPPPWTGVQLHSPSIVTHAVVVKKAAYGWW